VRSLRQLSRIAAETPASRNRYVDLLRALALSLVVVGHWLVTVVGYDRHGRPTGHSALESLTWAYPITWLFQVMPVFFVVGGYANAASLAAHRRRDGSAVGWLLERSARLVRPTTALLLVLAASVGARLVGIDPTEVRQAVWVASIPLWFLSAYLVVIALAPVMYGLHRRFGLAVPAVLVGLVALGDVARFTGRAGLAAGNFVFGWLVIHQVGFFWRDGRLTFTPRLSLPVLFGGAAALVLLTVVGPYPLSMIDVAGQRIKNASPPTLALLAAAAAQFGLIMLLARPAQRWLRRPRPWLVVVGANSVVLTIFLWHMTAVVLLVGGLSWAHLLPTPPVDSSAWWLWRVPWLIMLAIVLTALVAIFAPIEARSHRPPTAPGWLPPPVHRALSRPVPRLSLTIAAYTAVVVGLLVNNITSRYGHELFGIPATALVAYLAGASVLRLLRSVPQPHH
jgi:fucose 4-O-acetylase-like acetyltransferase